MSSSRRQFPRTSYCDNCKRPFKTTRSHAKYCSPRCRMAASRAGQKRSINPQQNVTLFDLEVLAKKYAEKLGSP